MMYKIDIGNEGDREYIIIDTDEEVLEYQVKMLQETDNYLVDLHVRGLNNKSVIYYDISGKRSLKDYCMEKNKLDFDSFIKIITGIVDCILNVPRLLLHENNLLLQSDYVFMDELLNVQLIYLPFNYNLDIRHQLRELILYLLLKNVTLKSDPRVSRFLDFLHDTGETLELRDIHRFLSLATEKEQGREEPDMQEKPPVNKRFKTSKSHMGFVLFQIILFTISGFIYSRLSGEIDEGYIMGGIVLFVVIWDALYLRLFGSVSIKKPSIKFISMNKRQIGIDKGINKDKDNKEIIPPIKIASLPEDRIENKHNTSYLDYKDETVLICNEVEFKQKIIFKAVDSGYNDINITGESFIIGRYPEKVNYDHDSKAVGRRHLLVDNFTIMDLDSKNGTFLNGERLEPQRLYTIEVDDNVVIANIPYRIYVMEE